jgi:hypothetical protein
MNRIKTVGELRAVLFGLPDDTTLRPAIPQYQVPTPGLYVIRYAPGTCSPAFAEVFIEPFAFGVTALAASELRIECDCTTEISADGKRRTYCSSDQMMRAVAAGEVSLPVTEADVDAEIRRSGCLRTDENRTVVRAQLERARGVALDRKASAEPVTKAFIAATEAAQARGRCVSGCAVHKGGGKLCDEACEREKGKSNG